jgi:pyruvate dehydrogenase E2 component (dihydrolipoamide acetyltransferase)
VLADPMPIPILMPALSPTMETGTLSKWHVKEGDKVSSGDVIAEIETDKANMEVEAVDEGHIGRILVSEGTENVAVNTPIALLLAEGEDKSALKDVSDSPSPKSLPCQPAADSGSDIARAASGNSRAQPGQVKRAPIGPDRPRKSSSPISPQLGERLRISPLARRLAQEKHLDVQTLQGSGPRGRIIKRDVETAGPAPLRVAASQTPQYETPRSSVIPAIDIKGFFPEGSYTIEPLSSMRRAVAKRLAQSMRERPHYYLSVDCVIDRLLALREELNTHAANSDEPYKLSVNDFIVRACALALIKVPEVNVSYSEEGMLYHKHADVAVAVALDGGLITPIVFEAENKGLATISNEIKDKAARAKERKLKPAEYEGGTFSVSNLGMFGIREFTAVINPPHSAILAVGAGDKRPIVREGRITAAMVMGCTLCCDHRAVDGAVGARFLQIFKALVEEPLDMLL